MGIFKPLPPRLQRGHPLARGLVGAWEFTEGSGLTAYDSSGYGNHGALSGSSPVPAWVGGRAGSSLQFNGVSGDGNIVIPNSPSINFSGSLTMVSWFNTLGQHRTGIRSIINKWEGSAATQYDMLINTSGKLIGEVYNTTHDTTVTSANAVDDGLWHQGVCVRDVIAGTLSLYIDGKSAATPASDLTTNLTNTDVLRIGALNEGDDVWFGLLDDVRLYNRALSAAEITLLYQMTGS